METTTPSRQQRRVENKKKNKKFKKDLADAEKLLDHAMSTYDEITKARADMFLKVHQLNTTPLQPIEEPIIINETHEYMFQVLIKREWEAMQAYIERRKLTANMVKGVNSRSRLYREKIKERVNVDELDDDYEDYRKEDAIPQQEDPKETQTTSETQPPNL